MSSEIIDKIKSLNLKEYPHKILKEYLRKLGAFVILKTLHKNKKIIRARINSNNEIFDNISKLSFKPKEYNKTYQRASTPFNTMFYGAVTPEYLDDGENNLERITIFSELKHSNEFLEDDESKGEMKITFARWDVIEDVNLVSIILHDNFQRRYSNIQNLQQEYIENIEKMEDNVKERSLEIYKFLSDEYAKEKINEDFDYLVSAIFSELAIEKYDGVYYPSVRMDGDGINVAIKPDTVNSNLKFICAHECTIYKNEEDFIIGNNTHSKLLENGKLEYIKIPNEPTPDFCRNEIGLK